MCLFGNTIIMHLRFTQNLKILPLKSKFAFTDLLIFHKIFYGNTYIKLPDYLIKVTDNDINHLRTSHLDKLCLKCIIHPRVNVFSDSYFHRTYFFLLIFSSNLKGHKKKRHIIYFTSHSFNRSLNFNLIFLYLY